MARRLMLPVTVTAMVLSALTPARADEAKSPPTAAIILGIVSGPVAERPDVAFDRSLREQGPRPARTALAGEVLPDGSVRYGAVTVTVKNPCPPGTAHYEPPALPGRRASTK